MNAISIIILVVMLLSVVISFFVLFKGKKAKNTQIVSSYNHSFNKILNEKYENNGERLTQKELIENTDYVLDAF